MLYLMLLKRFSSASSTIRVIEGLSVEYRFCRQPRRRKPSRRCRSDAVVKPHHPTTCAQIMHAIRILRSRGMGDAQLQLVYPAVVVAKLTYASSSWWGFTTASDRHRLVKVFCVAAVGKTCTLLTNLLHCVPKKTCDYIFYNNF